MEIPAGLLESPPGEVERCRRDGDHLMEARVEYEGPRGTVTHRDVLAWQGSTLVRIERDWEDGQVTVAFERLPAGVTAEALLREVEDELVERIPAAAAALERRESICALALGSGTWAADIRSAACQRYGEPDFIARCEQVDRQIRLRGDERVTGRLLQAVARRLNRLEWHDRLGVTREAPPA